MVDPRSPHSLKFTVSGPNIMRIRLPSTAHKRHRKALALPLVDDVRARNESLPTHELDMTVSLNQELE